MEVDELIGTWLGEFQILAPLGQGGMARVYKAMQSGLNRQVALKVILPEAASRPGFKERFRREAELSARLQHPNIVTIYAFGETRNLSYLAMQYVGGGTLSSKLRRGQPLPPLLAASYGAQMARALQHAHSKQVIHRDVKPSNMLLDENDINHLLLSDFGIAKLRGASDSDQGQPGGPEPLTVEGSIIGTPDFMAPEQALGQTIDARADIYALGMVLYFLLVGKHPFTSSNMAGMLYHHVHTIPPSASQMNPAIPLMLAEVVAQAVAKRPEERFQSAEALARALEDVLAMMQRDDGPTVLAQLGPTVLAPDAWANRPSRSLSGAPTQDRYGTNPQPITAPTPSAPFIPPPINALGAGVSGPVRPPSFHSAATPLPGQPPTVLAPPPPKPRRRLAPFVYTGISLLLTVAVLAFLGSPFSPFKTNPSATPTARTNNAPVTTAVTDTFKVNTNGWPAGHINNDSGLNWMVGNGAYDITITGSQAHSMSYFPAPANLGPPPTNFTLEIKVQQTQGSVLWGYGLIFRETVTSQDTVNCYAVTINSHGQYQFQVYHDSQASGPEFTSPPPNTLNSGLNQINDLKVEVTGSTFILYANDHILPGPNADNSWTDSSFSSGQVGLLVTGDPTQTQEYKFIYFALTPRS